MPVDLHASSPAELQARLAAERRGTPYLVYRDSAGHQVLVDLADGEPRTVGRRAGNALALGWDDAVSRTHAAFERVAADWTVADEGLSRNGTFVNGERLRGRHRLRDGDIIKVGQTAIAFKAPGGDGSGATRTLAEQRVAEQLTPAQRRVLAVLCRPYTQGDRIAAPASNREIAAELVVTPDAVKRTLRRLFDAFEIDDLPQNEKRTALAIAALRSGAIRAEE